MKLEQKIVVREHGPGLLTDYALALISLSSTNVTAPADGGFCPPLSL